MIFYILQINSRRKLFKDSQHQNQSNTQARTTLAIAAIIQSELTSKKQYPFPRFVQLRGVKTRGKSGSVIPYTSSLLFSKLRTLLQLQEITIKMEESSMSFFSPQFQEGQQHSKPIMRGIHLRQESQAQVDSADTMMHVNPCQSNSEGTHHHDTDKKQVNLSKEQEKDDDRPFRVVQNQISLGNQSIKRQSKGKSAFAVQNIDNGENNENDDSGTNNQNPQVIRPKSKRVNGKKGKALQTMTHINTLSLNLRDEVLKPIPEGKVLKAKITRFSSCFSNFLNMFLKGENKPYLLSERIFTPFGNRYCISLPEDGEKNLESNMETTVGALEGNIGGSIFNVYEISEGNKQIVASIYTNSSAKRMGGPREIQIYLRDRSSPTYIDPNLHELNLREIHKKDPKNPIVMKLKMVQPTYYPSEDLYCLPFNSSLPIRESIHNVIFCDQKNNEVLKFYKVASRNYILYAEHPVTAMVAYAYVLTSFTFKWVSQ